METVGKQTQMCVLYRHLYNAVVGGGGKWEEREVGKEKEEEEASIVFHLIQPGETLQTKHGV